MTRSYPARPVRTEPHSGDAGGPWRVAWVLPPWRIGSGGHTTIFRLIRQLELRGHKCTIHVFDPFNHNRTRAAGLREEIREHFVALDAEVFLGLEDFDSADVCSVCCDMDTHSDGNWRSPNSFDDTIARTL